jgi:hypothetical protein
LKGNSAIFQRKYDNRIRKYLCMGQMCYYGTNITKNHDYFLCIRYFTKIVLISIKTHKNSEMMQ